MAVPSETPQDTLVSFLPHRLNRQPVVVRGLTADELWICAGLSAAAGFALGLPLAWLTHSIAMVPTLIVAGSHDAVTTPDNARFMQARIADAQLVEFAAAHLSNVEAGDAFSRRLVDFLLSA